MFFTFACALARCERAFSHVASAECERNITFHTAAKAAPNADVNGPITLPLQGMKSGLSDGRFVGQYSVHPDHGLFRKGLEPGPILCRTLHAVT